MSCIMLSAALRCPGLSPSERIIYASLCDRANADDICWPSAEALAHDHELSRRAVFKALTELKTRGLIEVRPRRRKTSIYRVLPCTPIPRYAHASDAAPEPEHPFPSSEPINGAEFAPQTNGAEFAPIEPAPVEVQILPFKGAKNDAVEVQNLHPESPIESPIESPTTLASLASCAPAPARGPKPPGKKIPIPDDWAPNEAAFALADSLGLDRARVAFEADRMRDWAASGVGKGCSGWDARFRNWLRKAYDDQQFRRPRLVETRSVHQKISDEAFKGRSFWDDGPPITSATFDEPEPDQRRLAGVGA
jgi:biotin operon repressor